jgi:hypothetical protein
MRHFQCDHIFADSLWFLLFGILEEFRVYTWIHGIIWTKRNPVENLIQKLYCRCKKQRPKFKCLTPTQSLPGAELGLISYLVAAFGLLLHSSSAFLELFTLTFSLLPHNQFLLRYKLVSCFLLSPAYNEQHC